MCVPSIYGKKGYFFIVVVRILMRCPVTKRFDMSSIAVDGTSVEVTDWSSPDALGGALAKRLSAAMIRVADAERCGREALRRLWSRGSEETDIVLLDDELRSAVRGCEEFEANALKEWGTLLPLFRREPQEVEKFVARAILVERAVTDAVWRMENS